MLRFFKLMRPKWLGFPSGILWGFVTAWMALVSLQAKDSPPTPEELQEGERLASALRSSPPATELRYTGRLGIRDASGTLREVPILFQAMITPTNWISIYRSQSVGSNALSDHVAVAHVVSSTNNYWVASESSPDDWKPIAGDAESRAFAASDFSLSDLGLEFLHWPKQRVVRTEMRKSRSCHVLESSRVATTPGQYLKVLSWVDVESGGLYIAEAYDQQSRLLKEFSVNNMAKVDGRWQVKQMEIRNVQTRSRTRLDFEVK